MNFKKKIVMWIGIAIIVGMGLFPPWNVKSGSIIVSGGYYFLFSPPRYARAKGIDMNRLFLQMGLVTIITGGLILTLKKK